MHYKRVRRNGSTKRRRAPKRILSTPGVPDYHKAHRDVRTSRGRASDYACARCGRPAHHWAYDHSDPEPLTHPDGREYSADTDRYLPMCASCHYLMDAMKREGTS